MVRVKAVGMDWAVAEGLSEVQLEARLYGEVTRASTGRPPLPDPAFLHRELKRPGVTLELLHLEYLEEHPDGYRYTRFCEHYRLWLKRSRPSMRQEHRAGEKGFVDYSGKKPHIVDPRTGKCIEVELFVAVLGASSYTYAEASRSQQVPDWIASHTRAFTYFGGVPGALVPDQLKSGVTRSCRYEPEVHRTYQEMAAHYGTSILPARPAKPKDKPKVEVAVQVVQRWILARLRNHTFYSLAALNSAIWALLDDLNGRVMRDYQMSRRQLFEQLDQPALRPLPSEPFIYGEWKNVKVNIDYHVEVGHHFYSVPHGLIHERLEARASAMTVEILSARTAHRLPPAQLPTWRLHHRSRAHAQSPPEAPGVDALAPDPLGRFHRSQRPGAGRSDPRRTPSPGGGLSLLPGHPTTLQAVPRSH